jgi:DHA2 family multidrug resistance protein
MSRAGVQHLSGQPGGEHAGAGPAAAGKKWLVTFAVMSGAFLAVMDTTVVNVALPHMMGSFGQTLSAITWVATSYSIAEMIMVTMAGWWSALFGRKRFYLYCFVLFTLGSILAGTAQSFPQLLLYRLLQGLGGGSLIPLSQAILRETFPVREQGMAMAVFGMGVVLAPALGPILGGWLTDSYGWPWIFYINLPVSLVGILMVSAWVEDPPYLRRGITRIDWVGIALLTGGLTGMQLVLERGQEHQWFDSNWIAGGALITIMMLISLVAWELRTKEPVIDFRVLRNVPLSVGSGMGLLFGMALFGTTFSLPAFTQRLLHYSAYEAGWVLFPRAVTLFLVMPIAGWLFNHVNSRLLIAVGVGLTYWGFHQLAHLSLDAGFWDLAPIMLLMGAGMPCIFVTLSTVSLRAVRREDMTAATGLYTLARRVGGNISYALVATFIERFSIIHRSDLVKHVSDFNSLFLDRQTTLTSRLIQQGADPVAAQSRALALANAEVNRQATMLAYNDIAWIFGFMFLGTLPLLLLLRARRAAQPTIERTGP